MADSVETERSAGAPLPLQALRVLDVCQVMAGPFCCMLLGDLGADVIKVEPPEGDQARRAMGFKLKGDDSLGFLNMNRNKRSIILDLKSEAGRKAFLRLAETADVIVENYRPGAMKKLGVDYEAVRAVNPAIIYASISGFGQTGPWADRPGFDLIAQAASGIISVTGAPDGPPARAGVPVTDIGCSLFTLYAILAAYIGRQATGRGPVHRWFALRGGHRLLHLGHQRILGHGPCARPPGHRQPHGGALRGGSRKGWIFRHRRE